MKIKVLKKEVLGQYPNLELKEAFDSIINITDDSDITIEEIKEELEIDSHEIADSMVDHYTANLLEWYGKDLKRMYYMDEAIGNGAETGFDVLTQGQYAYWLEKIEEVKGEIKKWLENN